MKQNQSRQRDRKRFLQIPAYLQLQMTMTSKSCRQGHADKVMQKCWQKVACMMVWYLGSLYGDPMRMLSLRVAFWIQGSWAAKPVEPATVTVPPSLYISPKTAANRLDLPAGYAKPDANARADT